MRRRPSKRSKSSWFKSDFKPRQFRRGTFSKRYLGSRARRSFSKRRYN